MIICFFPGASSSCFADLDAHASCVMATSIAQAVAESGPFDLVLLDYALPDSQGNKGLERVRTAHEGVPVVILSGETRLQLVSDLVELGAAGFISKASDTEVLLSALRTVLSGGIYLPRQLLGVPSPNTSERIHNLSPRQVPGGAQTHARQDQPPDCTGTGTGKKTR